MAADAHARSACDRAPPLGGALGAVQQLGTLAERTFDRALLRAEGTRVLVAALPVDLAPAPARGASAPPVVATRGGTDELALSAAAPAPRIARPLPFAAIA